MAHLGRVVALPQPPFEMEETARVAGDERSRAAGTVKNVDLYKMHTYNEAIRRTVGSYGFGRDGQ